MTLLYMDLLGIRTLWHEKGRAGVEEASDNFKDLLVSSLKKQSTIRIIDGGLETDSACLVFKNTTEAIKFGTEFYLDAFMSVKNKNDKRPWIRGAIMPYDGKLPLRSSEDIDIFGATFRVFKYSPDLLNSISVEKSGVKGMRLLVSSGLIKEEVKRNCKLSINGGYLFPFKKLEDSEYPGRLATGYQDILWMMTSDQTQWKYRKLIMEKRLRWSSMSSFDEFTQASYSQVIFHQCAAIFENEIKKNTKKKKRSG